MDTRGDEEGEKRKRERTEAAEDVERELARARREGGGRKKMEGEAKMSVWRENRRVKDQEMYRKTEARAKR